MGCLRETGYRSQDNDAGRRRSFSGSMALCQLTVASEQSRPGSRGPVRLAFDQHGYQLGWDLCPVVGCRRHLGEEKGQVITRYGVGQRILYPWDMEHYHVHLEAGPDKEQAPPHMHEPAVARIHQLDHPPVVAMHEALCVPPLPSPHGTCQHYR